MTINFELVKAELKKEGCSVQLKDNTLLLSTRQEPEEAIDQTYRILTKLTNEIQEGTVTLTRDTKEFHINLLQNTEDEAWTQPVSVIYRKRAKVLNIYGKEDIEAVSKALQKHLDVLMQIFEEKDYKFSQPLQAVLLKRLAYDKRLVHQFPDIQAEWFRVKNDEVVALFARKDIHIDVLRDIDSFLAQVVRRDLNISKMMFSLLQRDEVSKIVHSQLLKANLSVHWEINNKEEDFALSLYACFIDDCKTAETVIHETVIEESLDAKEACKSPKWIDIIQENRNKMLFDQNTSMYCATSDVINKMKAVIADCASKSSSKRQSGGNLSQSGQMQHRKEEKHRTRDMHSFEMPKDYHHFLQMPKVRSYIDKRLEEENVPCTWQPMLSGGVTCIVHVNTSDNGVFLKVQRIFTDSIEESGLVILDVHMRSTRQWKELEAEYGEFFYVPEFHQESKTLEEISIFVTKNVSQKVIPKMEQMQQNASSLDAIIIQKEVAEYMEKHDERALTQIAENNGVALDPLKHATRWQINIRGPSKGVKSAHSELKELVSRYETKKVKIPVEYASSGSFDNDLKEIQRRTQCKIEECRLLEAPQHVYDCVDLNKKPLPIHVCIVAGDINQVQADMVLCPTNTCLIAVGEGAHIMEEGEKYIQLIFAPFYKSMENYIYCYSLSVVIVVFVRRQKP